MKDIEDDEQKAERKPLRVESNNPQETTRWKILWELDRGDWVATQSLIDDLNIINAPVQLRIVPNTDSIISGSLVGL